MKLWNLLIVGAGPAGLNAAIAAAENGLRVKVIDEFMKVGGRLLGQLHEESKNEWWNGIKVADTLHQKATSLGVTITPGVSVYDLERAESGWDVYTTKGLLQAEKLLLATGATEIPSPVPGWTTPGVLSIGAAQVMGNVHRVKPGNSCIIIGTNVLSIAIANELKLCGVEVKEMILPPLHSTLTDGGAPEKVMASLMKLTHLAPSAILRQAGKIAKFIKPEFAVKFYPNNGLKVFDIPIKLKTSAVEIIGDNDKVKAVKTVRIRSNGEAIPNTEEIKEIDFVCIAGGLAPLPELAALAGCTFKYVHELGGHIPFHSERMQTNIADLFVAGNITGVESAKVAMAQGTVAGLAIAAEINGTNDNLELALKHALATVKKERATALIQFQPKIKEAREQIYQSFENEIAK